MNKRYITLPNGKRVSLRTYTHAWKALLEANPSAIVPGWEWYDVTAGEVLYAMRRGLQDRINKRGNLTIRESRAHPAPLRRAQDGRSRIEPSAWKTFSPAARKALAHRAYHFAA